METGQPSSTDHVLQPAPVAVQLTKNKMSMTSNIGTTLYLSPEVAATGGRARYDQRVDLYSLGIILFEMCHELQSMHERAIVIQVSYTSLYEVSDNYANTRAEAPN